MIDYVFPNYLLGMMFIAGYANYPTYVLILRSKLKESGWHAVFLVRSQKWIHGRFHIISRNLNPHQQCLQ
jgi:hypothetical protein